MKRLLLFLAVLMTASSAFAQSMRISPDTAAQGTLLQVTITGMGTRFSSTMNVSFVGVILEGGGSSVQSSSASLLSDTTISAAIAIGSQMPTGVYNLIVQVVDTTEHQFTKDSAFRVTPGLPYIASVSPSSAYDSQQVSIQITGSNTNFLTGSTPTISFLQNGTTSFTASSDSVLSNTSIAASVMVPNGAAAGACEVIVANGSYSDTGRQAFNVLGPAPTSEHVPMIMTPDSGFPQEQLSVTIVGNGTQFANTNNISGITVALEHNNSVVTEGTNVNLVNDSTISTPLEVSSEMQVGSYYDLVVQVNSTPEHTYIRDSAFLVVAPAPSIVSVSPSSAYDSQTVAIQITGQSTNFLSGTTPTVSFERNGTTDFSAQSVSVTSNTSINASVTLPGGTAAGAYDVIVQNTNYSDTGKSKFTALGPEPAIEIIPDSGAASTAFDVSIVGQHTNFAPTNNISEPLPMNIDLDSSGVSVYHTTADTVFSATSADAIFTIPGTLTPGEYDADIHGQTYSGSSYDYHTSFLVTPHPIIGVGNNNVPRADTVTITVNGSGVNFISGNQDVTKVQLLQEDPDTITASKVTVASNTSLSAFFTIPANATAGLYDIAITEPGTNRIVTGPRAFSIDTISLEPDSAKTGDTIGGCLSGLGTWTDSIKSMYLRRNASILRVFVENRLPECFPIGIDIPANAEPGSYDFIIVLNQGDSIVTPNAFTIEGLADVNPAEDFTQSISNLHVSPNPAQDNLTISFAVNAPTHVRLRLFDALGRTVATLCDRNLATGPQSFAWATQAMPAGGYFYELSTGEELYGGRIVVRH